MTCSVPDCGNAVRTKGYCSAHYQRLCRHGDPLGGGTSPGEPMRFVREVAMLHTSGECLAWPFGKDTGGYGRISIDGKMAGAHRYVCELVNGPPPTPDHDAAHSCGNGHEACIAPGHLSWKTKADNQADRLIHGTHGRGERQGQAKLTEADVREIRSKKGVELIRELAERFGVAQSNISLIQSGRTWAWLNEPQEREMA